MSPLPRLTLNKREYFRINFLSQENHEQVLKDSGKFRSIQAICGKNAEKFSSMIW